jgi:hypothetical protein
MAEYNWRSDTIWLNRGFKWADLMHELVHALDDQNSWHIQFWTQDYEAAEALAYGAVDHLLVKADMLFEVLEDPQRTSNCEKARQRWAAAWQTLNGGILATPGVFPNQEVWWQGKKRPLQAADLWDVNAKLGVRFSCSQLKPIYEEFLLKRGLWDTRTARPLPQGSSFSNLVAGPCACELTCDFPDFSLDPVLR